MKKIYALVPSEREKECEHNLVAWTGKMPCTGRHVCYMCGTDFTDTQRGKLC